MTYSTIRIAALPAHLEHALYWFDWEAGRAFGPFESLQTALTALPAVAERAEDPDVLLCGIDELGKEFDAYSAQEMQGETAESFRADMAAEAENYRAECFEESRRAAGMAHGDRGLADHY